MWTIWGGGGRAAYRVLVGISKEGKKALGRPGFKCMDNIKVYLQRICLMGVDWIHPAQFRDKNRAVVNAVMNIRFPYNEGIFFTS